MLLFVCIKAFQKRKNEIMKLICKTTFIFQTFSINFLIQTYSQMNVEQENVQTKVRNQLVNTVIQIFLCQQRSKKITSKCHGFVLETSIVEKQIHCLLCVTTSSLFDTSLLVYPVFVMFVLSFKPCTTLSTIQNHVWRLIFV